MKNLIGLSLFLFSVLFATSISAQRQVSHGIFVKGNRFVDTLGAPVILRGWNLSAKVPPFLTMATSASFEQLESWGTNVIRLSFIWEAIEAVRGQYNESYLQQMDQLIQFASEKNIWVIIDIHQDAFSRYSLGGCGEGFPLWAVSGQKSQPDNGEDCEDWGSRMFYDFTNHGPMQKEWEAFYSNERGVRDRYLDLISMLTRRHTNNPAVIGIDLLNEPFGSIDQIYHLYEEAAEKVHSIDPEWLIFASPHALTSGSVNAVSFGDPPPIPNLVLSPHYYDPAIMQYHRYQGPGRFLGENGGGIWGTLAGWLFPDLRAAITNLSAMASPGGIDIRTPEKAIADLKQISDKWGVPLFIGEFGTPATAIDQATFLDRFYTAMNQHGVSGAQWIYAPQWTPDEKDGWNHEDLSVVDDKGRERRGYRPHPYVVRVAGEFVDSNSFFERSDGPYAKGITLTYHHQPSKGKTRIFMPELAVNADYLDQFSVDLSSGRYQIDHNKRHVVITSDEETCITVTSQYNVEILQQRCRIYFEHRGFACSDGISIRFEGVVLNLDRELVRYADYPWDQAYDFGEWPIGQVIEISAQRNSSDSPVSRSFVVQPNLCGRVIDVDGRASCFDANWDLSFSE
jgi:endoglycosylceramidase